MVKLPIHEDLAEALALLPPDADTFLKGELGRSLFPNTLSVKMRKWCDEAGLPDCNCHGLRKACATRLSNVGASAHEIMAWTGHSDISMVTLYTRKAEREGLAEAGMAKMTKLSNRENVVVNHPKRFAKNDGK